MIELYLSKVTENSETETAGKMYARVSYKQSMDLHDMAHHMAEHNTAFSEGLIVGVLTDFVKCVREMVLNGNTVKVGNLAIFKATVESNGLEVLYDAQNDKVASATMGVLKEGDKTGAAVKQDWCCREDHQAAGSEHRRLHPRGAEEGCQAELDRQDQGGDCSCQGNHRWRNHRWRNHRSYGFRWW